MLSNPLARGTPARILRALRVLMDIGIQSLRAIGDVSNTRGIRVIYRDCTATL